MARKTKILTLSVPPELIDELDDIAKSKKTDRSKLSVGILQDFSDIEVKSQETLRTIAIKKNKSITDIVELLVDKFPLDDDTVKPIVLKIPVKALQDKESLSLWLNSKCNALVNLFFPENLK